MIHPYIPGCDHAWWAYWAIIGPWNVYSIIGMVRSYRAMRKSRDRLLETCAWWQGHTAAESAWLDMWRTWVLERVARGEPPPPFPKLRTPERPGN